MAHVGCGTFQQLISDDPHGKRIIPCCVPAQPSDVTKAVVFAWGKDAKEAVHNAVVLEEVAMMAWHTEALPEGQPRACLPDHVKEKHFMRKHGPNAYYGQKKP